MIQLESVPPTRLACCAHEEKYLIVDYQGQAGQMMRRNGNGFKYAQKEKCQRLYGGPAAATAPIYRLIVYILGAPLSQ